MRDNGIHEGLGDGALGWIAGLAKEALGQLASVHRQKTGAMLQEQLDFLMDTVCGASGDDPVAVLHAMRGRQMGLRALATAYIPAAARLLGTRWEHDEITFVDVTVCAARLQSLLHQIDRADDRYDEEADASALILVPQAEQHTLGAYVLASVLHKAGIVANVLVAPTAAELAQALAVTKYELALVSVSCTSGLAASARMICTLRLLTRVPMRIVIGGSLAEDDARMKEISGADEVLRDASAIIARYAPPADGAALDRGAEIAANKGDGTPNERL